MKPVISEAETAGNQEVRGLACMVMATAFFRKEKFADARKYMKIVVRFLENEGSDPDTIATGFMETAKMYEEMKEYEATISLLQKALNVPELSQDYFTYFYFTLLSLVSLTGMDKKKISSLEEVVEKVKEKFGPEHCHVGYGYEKLGLVYMDLGRPEMAVDLFVRAKDIFDVSLGSYHFDSLNASQALFIAYVGVRSYDLAIENQEKVVEGFKRLGLSEQDNMDKVVQVLNMMNGESIGEVVESHTGDFHQSKNGEDLSAAD